ncbi:Poly [ADP-ribose] polymerase 6 [Balamuthia mandrillaris]
MASSSQRKKVAEQIKQLKQRFQVVVEQDDSDGTTSTSCQQQTEKVQLIEMERDEQILSFTVRTKKEEAAVEVTMRLPDDLKNGEYLVYQPDGKVKAYKVCDTDKEDTELLAVFERLCIDIFPPKKDENEAATRSNVLARSFDSLANSRESCQPQPADSLASSEDNYLSEDIPEEEVPLEELRAIAEVVQEWFGGVIDVDVLSVAAEGFIRVYFEPSLFVGHREARALGVAHNKKIVVELAFKAPFQFSNDEAAVPHRARVSQVERIRNERDRKRGDKKQKRKKEKEKEEEEATEEEQVDTQSFGLGWQLSTRLQEFFSVSIERRESILREWEDEISIGRKRKSRRRSKNTRFNPLKQQTKDDVGQQQPEASVSPKKHSVILAKFFSQQKDSKQKETEQKERQQIVVDKQLLVACREMGFGEQLVRKCATRMKQRKGVEPSMEHVEELLDLLTTYRPKTVFMEDGLAVSNNCDVSIGSGVKVICQALQYLERCIRKCTAHCVICDKPLDFEGLKPTVCNAALCLYSYESFGLGVDVATELREQPDVVDLLINLTYSGANGARRDQFFNPFPSGVEVRLKDGEVLSFCHQSGGAEQRNWELLQKVLDLFPSVTNMSKYASDNTTLKAALDARHPLLYPLLRWILTSNRSHLKKIPTKKQITELQTSHQYVLLNAPVDRERRFQELKNEHGSFYAFHASPIGNWHSILRTGLKNLSNSAQQLHGAVNGPGIYLAPNSGLSMGYMGWGVGWPKSQLGTNELGMMAMCEVINYQDRINKHHGHYCGNYVVEQEDHIVTRFFLIWNTKGTQQGDFYQKPENFVDVQATALKVPYSPAKRT